MDPQAGEDGDRPPPRGYGVPDVRVKMGLLKTKGRRNNQPRSGNLNMVENMTRTELEDVLINYLRSQGIAEKEFERLFEIPRRIGDQGPVGNAYNHQSSLVYRVMAGSRREFFYLQIESQKNNSPEIYGAMKGIITKIGLLMEDVQRMIKAVEDIGRVAYRTPRHLLSDLPIPPKPVKSKRKKK